jgi:Domain of unknown function (DUF4338)
MLEGFEFFSTGMGLASQRAAAGIGLLGSTDAAQPPKRFCWTNAAALVSVRWATTLTEASETRYRESPLDYPPSSPIAIFEPLTFCGRRFDAGELRLMHQLAREFSALGVTEIARTACELLEWKRPSGRLKDHECRQLLERLNAEGFLKLPELRKRGGKGLRRPDLSGACLKPAALECDASDCEPLDLVLVEGKAESRRWREQVERHHYLGCRVPFGANLRYWVRNGDRDLACLLWTSPAWKMRARDTWISWTDEQRRRNLQRIVNNSRFLILPGVRVKGLASKILALSARQVPHDWESCYGCRPLLLETLVEATRFRGTCYRAANWIHVGQTAGRGRMDREHQAHGQAVKDIYVYPLVRDARQRLCSDPAPTPGNAPRAELVDAHSLFARLVWHQVRPRGRTRREVRARIKAWYPSKASTGLNGAPDVDLPPLQKSAPPVMTAPVAPRVSFPRPIETLFGQLARRRLPSLAPKEGF